MNINKRYSFKNILWATLWTCMGAGIVVLLVAAIHKKDLRPCRGIEISIKGVNNNFFVDKTDVLNSITALANGNPVGKPIGSFDLKKMESALEKNDWVKNVELFFDNTEMLFVNVLEREPIARVFSSTGATFYIDEQLSILPLSEKFSARLPVFTNFPSDRNLISSADSSLLKDIKNISLAIQKDSFSSAMITQIDITPQRTFEMIPTIGNQVIVFGDASDVDDKLTRLGLFYKKIMVKAGWSNYSIINLQYRNQVVAKIRGAEDVASDSLRTLQLMQMIAANAEKLSADSLQNITAENENNTIDSSMIKQSIQRDDNNEQFDSIEKPITNIQPLKPPVLNSSDPNATKNETKQNVIPVKKPKPFEAKKNEVKVKKIIQKPKAAMPKRNDY